MRCALSDVVAVLARLASDVGVYRASHAEFHTLHTRRQLTHVRRFYAENQASCFTAPPRATGDCRAPFLSEGERRFARYTSSGSWSARRLRWRGQIFRWIDDAGD